MAKDLLGSSIGANSVPYYNPARYAAEHDLVAVNINYVRFRKEGIKKHLC
jgi:hypothetical protein